MRIPPARFRSDGDKATDCHLCCFGPYRLALASPGCDSLDVARRSRQVAFAVVLLTGVVFVLVGLPTIGALLVALFVVWWVLVGIRDLRR